MNAALPIVVVLMCQPRFAPRVRDGTKTQTDRPPRKRPVKVGDRLSLRMWTGRPYRSKQQVLREAVCVGVDPVRIATNGIARGEFFFSLPHAFARADGFADWPDMRDWFQVTHGLPFEGVVISWK